MYAILYRKLHLQPLIMIRNWEAMLKWSDSIIVLERVCTGLMRAARKLIYNSLTDIYISTDSVTRKLNVTRRSAFISQQMTLV